MLGYLRRNAVAFLALFIAMSGTAYAAVIGPDSVNSASIINGQVKTVDLANGAVTPAKNASIQRIRIDGLVADQSPVFTVGGETLTYSCTGSGTDYMEIMTQATTGTVNGLFVKSDNSVAHVGYGGGGVILELFANQGASGVLIFQSGTTIQTLNFHAFVGAAGDHYCQLFGSLVKT